MGAQESLQLDCCSDRDDPETRRMLSHSKRGGAAASPQAPLVPLFGQQHSSAAAPEKRKPAQKAGHAALMEKFPSKDLRYPSGARCIVVEPVSKKKVVNHTPSEMEAKPITPYLSPGKEMALHRKDVQKKELDAPVSMVGEWDRLANDRAYRELRSGVQRQSLINSRTRAKQDVNKQFKGNFLNPFPSISIKTQRSIGREGEDYTTLSDDEREYERQRAVLWPKKEDPMYDPYKPQPKHVFKKGHESQ